MRAEFPLRYIRSGSGKVSFFLFLVLFACGMSSHPALSTGTDESNANHIGALQNSSQSATAAYETMSGVCGVFHAFIADEMKDAYESAFGASYQMNWMNESRLAGRIQSVGLFATGNPLFPDTSWEVSSSELQMFVVSVEGSFIYQLKERPLEQNTMPYVGVGFGGFFGFERFSVQISRFAEGDFNWNETHFRYVLGGHAFAGTTVRITDRYRALFEVRWTQSGKGSTVKNSFSDEEIANGWLEADKAVKRPDFNFTGVSVSAGIQW